LAWRGQTATLICALRRALINFDGVDTSAVEEVLDVVGDPSLPEVLLLLVGDEIEQALAAVSNAKGLLALQQALASADGRPVNATPPYSARNVSVTAFDDALHAVRKSRSPRLIQLRECAAGLRAMRAALLAQQWDTMVGLLGTSRAFVCCVCAALCACLRACVPACLRACVHGVLGGSTV
jgi:hypothetical protein